MDEAIRYSGSSGVTIRSNWQYEGGRPVIVHAEPGDRNAAADRLLEDDKTVDQA